MSQKTLGKIIQITDNHLLSDSQKKFLGVNTYEHLNNIIDDINNKIKAGALDIPDLILFTGDISQDYSKESYQLFLKLCEKIPYKITAIPGNHDDLNLFNNILPTSKLDIKTKKFDFANWQIILLNSHWPFHVAGFLALNELDFLETTLKNNQAKNTIIFLHHHTMPTNEAWLDRHILQNRNDFFALIDKYHHVKAIVCGHIHQENSFWRNEVNLISTPATAFQFAKFQQTFKLDTLMPGYRIFNLLEDGSFETKILRLNHDPKFIPDLASEGY